MSSVSNDSISKKLSELQNALSAFYSYFQNRTYEDGSIVPHFIYIITPNDNGELVSFSLGENDTNSIPDPTRLNASNTDDSITAVIKSHISDNLQKLYANSIPSHDSSLASSEGEIPVAPAPESTVDKIIIYYNTHTTELSTAVDDINKTYYVQLVSNTAEMSGLEADNSVINAFAKNKDVTNIDELSALLNLEKNHTQFDGKEYIAPTTGGGSRSRKHRRRHKQKKNKNTKRRSRK